MAIVVLEAERFAEILSHRHPRRRCTLLKRDFQKAVIRALNADREQSLAFLGHTEQRGVKHDLGNPVAGLAEPADRFRLGIASRGAIDIFHDECQRPYFNDRVGERHSEICLLSLMPPAGGRKILARRTAGDNIGAIGSDCISGGPDIRKIEQMRLVGMIELVCLQRDPPTVKTGDDMEAALR